jgi:hypothetical protein
VIESPPHHPKVKGLKPAANVGSRREKIAEKEVWTFQLILAKWRVFIALATGYATHGTQMALK